MSHADLAGLSVVTLAVVLGLLGGWVWAGANAVPAIVRPAHRAMGVFLFLLSASALNKIRLAGVGVAEDWSMTGLRLATVAAGAVALSLLDRRNRSRPRRPTRDGSRT
jgi:hypothetical protein